VNLKKLVIQDLFGHFKHVIKFKDENITILTAPNGYGKTICLKVIDSIFNRKFHFLSELQFSQIELETSEGTLFLNKDIESISDGIIIRLSTIDRPHTYSPKLVQENLKISREKIDMFIPFLDRIGPNEWIDERTGEYINYPELIDRYSEHFPDTIKENLLPDWFIKFSNSLNAHFIQDQRLILRKEVHQNRRVVRHRQDFVDTIEKYAHELAELIRESGLKSSYVSQELDSTFPDRLLKKDYNFKSLTVEQLKIELQKLQERRTELSNFNLLSSDRSFPALYLNEIRQEDTKVLTLYVDDTQKKSPTSGKAGGLDCEPLKAVIKP